MLTDEPTYEYIKGQGWVITSPVESIEFEYRGRGFLLLARKPREGELYTYCGKENPVYVTVDGEPKLDRWINLFFTWKDPTELKKYITDGRLLKDAAYVTVIPL